MDPKSIRNWFRRYKKIIMIFGSIFDEFWVDFGMYFGAPNLLNRPKKASKRVSPYQVASGRGLGRHFGRFWDVFGGHFGDLGGHFGAFGGLLEALESFLGGCGRLWAGKRGLG